jgi:KRAB domain-containing zinc finger protein
MLTHDPELVKKHIPYHSCSTCGKHFLTTSALKIHMAVHIENKPFQCERCDKRFTIKYYLKDHMNSVHNTGEKQYKCSFHGCERDFATRDYLNRHFKRHFQRINFPCDQCGEIFLNETKRKYHMVGDHGVVDESVSVFNCEVCGKSFYSQTGFKEHQLTHSTDVDDERLVCQVCGKIFLTHSSIRHHARGICGKNAFKYRCRIENCQRRFFQEKTLKKHMKAHDHGRFKCETCQAVFSRRISLRKHLMKLGHTTTGIRTDPGKPFGYKCEACHKKFFTFARLKNHTCGSSHSIANEASQPQAEYACRQCGQEFYIKFELMNHIKVSHAMAYVCHICGERFKKYDEVGDHMKANHELD